MYAVIETGGKQYKVTGGDVIEVEKLDLEAGAKVDLDVVMTVDGDKVETGKPYLSKKAKAEVVANGKGKKIVVYKYKAKKNERKKKGHRQQFTKIKILTFFVCHCRSSAAYADDESVVTLCVASNCCRSSSILP